MTGLASSLLPWFKQHGRHDLPWQRDVSPYRVWVSEIMLQQTQVKTVIPYFIRFVERFPDVNALAEAPLDKVLHLWTGLGYYARARNMQRAAQVIVRDFAGRFPEDADALTALPGIGRSTAGAILALSLDRTCPILDGNVKRVLTRFYGIHGWPGHKQVEDRLWQLAGRETPQRKTAAYTQAIMDLGATVCTRSRPRCAECPLASGCHAFRHSEQHRLPTRKTTKPIPVRQVVFALLENERGEILLEKRPPAGVWGGLWSFPEYKSNTELSAWIKTRGSLVSEELTTLPEIRHTFSHFHLDITPVKGIIRDKADTIRDNGEFLWYSPGHGPEIGMAAPVRELINQRSLKNIRGQSKNTHW